MRFDRDPNSQKNMNIRMANVRALILLLLLVITSVPVRADELRQRAINNPLDCALFVTQHDRYSSSTEELARAFFEAKRYDEVLRAIALDPDETFRWSAYYAEKLLDAGDRPAAEKFIAAAFAAIPAGEWNPGYGVNEFLRSLVRTGRDKEVAEVLSRLEDDPDLAQIYLVLARAYAQNGDRARTTAYIKLLDQSGYSWNRNAPYFIAEAYDRVGDREASLKVMQRFEADVLANPEIGLRDEALLLLIDQYLRFGDGTKAWVLWRQISDPGDSQSRLSLVQLLVAVNRFDEAKPYLSQLETDPTFVAQNGDDLVEAYLKMGEVESASRIAVGMSDEDDSYDQQRALMHVADRYIEIGNRDAALRILDLAFGKAGRVVETHRMQDSVGASPLTRKIQYFGAIFDRYAKLGRFDRATQVLRAFKTNHEYGRAFVAQSLAELAELQAKSLDRRALMKLLDEALGIANESAVAGYSRDEILMAAAGAYAKLGEPGKALSLIRTFLATEFQRSASITKELIAAGEVVEKNKLTADPELRKVLRKIVESADE